MHLEFCTRLYTPLVNPFLHRAGAVSYYANSYGEAPGETFRGGISCAGSETNVSQCSFSGNEANCDPRYTLGVSCNTGKSVNIKGPVALEVSYSVLIKVIVLW